MAEKAVSSIPAEYSEEFRIMTLKSKKAAEKKDIVRYLQNRGFTFESIYRIADYNT